ncbi:MAG TPA: cysteine--tRNA ligase [Bryobacteraceae bacterium]|nr:cysteine--tRNA ligase [Bryobacteraceae bacterium]
MALRFFNTLTQQVEDFSTQDGKTVRMYTCGPTVYHYVHIGNLRTFTFQDLLRRWLRYRGYTLMHVMNITDVEDKIIRNAMQQGKSLNEYTEVYEKAFLEDSDKLRLERPERLVRATEHIPEMIDAIAKLKQDGYTYVSDGSVYFRIAQFPNYGKLARLDFSGMKSGARVDVDEYDKDDARDFVLWKSRKEGEPCWESDFGPGRPGWHIECSVMAMKYLGETLDIHAGGIDLTFPHHENEIAQSEAITHKTFSRFWLHAEHLMVEGQKMSKSLGNFYTLRDLFEQGWQADVIRYLLTSAHYRTKLNFTMEGLRSHGSSLDRLRNFKLRLDAGKFPEGVDAQLKERTAKALSDFELAMDDDLNTAGALAAIFEFVRDANSAMDSGQFLSGNGEAALSLLATFDSIFDVLRPVEREGGLSDEAIDTLVNERIAAKKSKNFARSDEIRNLLQAQGVILEDTREGTRWKRK